MFKTITTELVEQYVAIQVCTHLLLCREFSKTTLVNEIPDTDHVGKYREWLVMPHTNLVFDVCVGFFF